MDNMVNLSGKDQSVKHIATLDDTETPNLVYRSGWGELGELYDIVAANERARIVLERSGLHRFFQIKMKRNDQQLTYGILERWWYTTNSFHFPQFEIGFTPLDFVLLSGIPIGNGRQPLIFHSTTGWSEDKYDEIEEEFMIPLRDLGVVRGYNKKRADLSTSCLADFIKLKSGEINDYNWMHVTRYFLLWVIGKVFMASSTTRVSKGWLETLRDLDRIGEYDWGSAAFSRLYRDMSLVAKGGKNIGGMWMLLEYWFYSYFHTLTPLIKASVNPVDYWPAVMVFSRDNLTPRQRDSKKRSLSEARNQIELRTRSGTVWQPWEYTHFFDNADIVHARELSMKRVYFYDPQYGSGVHYLGERFLRQLTGVIVIPVSPRDPMTIPADPAFIREPTEVVEDQHFTTVDERTYFRWWKQVSLGYTLGVLRRQDNRDEVGAASTQDPGFMVDHVPPMHPTRYEYDHVQPFSPDFPQCDWNVQHSDHFGNPINVPVQRPYPRTEFDGSLGSKAQWIDLCERYRDLNIATNAHFFELERERAMAQHIGEGSTSRQPSALDPEEDSPVRLRRKRPATDGAYIPTAPAPQPTDSQDFTQNANLTDLLTNPGISMADMEDWEDL